MAGFVKMVQQKFAPGDVVTFTPGPSYSEEVPAGYVVEVRHGSLWCHWFNEGAWNPEMRVQHIIDCWHHPDADRLRADFTAALLLDRMRGD